MNKIRVVLAAAALLFTTATAVQAQAPLKIGYTSVEYILSQMPESKQIESQLKDYSTQLRTQLDTKATEYRTKGEAYQKGASTMTDVVRADKEKELQNLQNSIQEFQQNAETSLQQKQQTLLKPALDKLQKTIDDVATENGYTYVLNSDGASPVLLHGPKDGDISDLVLKKMGITPGAAAAAPKVSAPSVAPAATPAGASKTKTKKK
ncbi:MULTISPECIES: OmpH family outer membrane protein [Hymenobacter]|uniref:OmpH family outer membrane protein n=1 Tax=Hymenobacter jejuensis TaxID=2502781 RepID=A0A5B7ZX89_9BACT|nr:MULTISPECIES: OmpH family outer membrane protein [Hymenobacter]MBC6991397.1 OmpH family outer membrane protein [Hymenobacter sp. BT491]QDA59734.1 OmpH family outer membrane protein [Hymenobacter jejuensis]